MQQCGDCLKVYDESEYTHCPYCDDDDELEELSEDEPWTDPCADCDGTGRTECNECEGEGEVDGEICSVCNGEGDMECPDCDGLGEATYHMGKKI